MSTIPCIIQRSHTRARRLTRGRPFEDWKPVECVHRLRRLLETRMGNPGRLELIQVLRLMEDFHQHQVEQTVSEGAAPLVLSVLTR